jgi:hypothetical protein
MARTAIQRTTPPHRDFCGGGDLEPTGRASSFDRADFRAAAFFPPCFLPGFSCLLVFLPFAYLEHPVDSQKVILM